MPPFVRVEAGTDFRYRTATPIRIAAPLHRSAAIRYFNFLVFQPDS